GGDCDRFGDGEVDAVLDLIVAFGRFGQLAIPDDLDSQRPSLIAGGGEGGLSCEGAPVLEAHVESLAFGATKSHDVLHGLTVSLQTSLGLPRIQVAGDDRVEHRIDDGLLGALE